MRRSVPSGAAAGERPSVGKSDRGAREDVVLAQAAWMKSRRSLRCDVVLDVLAVKAATCGAYNARGSAPT